MKLASIAALLVVLSGCDGYEAYRNSPNQQVVDYGTCKAGGMRAYLNGYAEVSCAPPEENEELRP